MNQDKVIDIYDAIAIQDAWRTETREADINFDGKVDAMDMTYEQKNYLKQNRHMDDSPSPRKKHQGKQ